MEEQFLPLHRDPVFLQPAQIGQVGKHSGHQSRLSPGADEFTAGAFTQYRTDGINDDGLTRAGLTGQDVESVVKTDVGRLYDGDILDMKQRKHRIAPFREVIAAGYGSRC